METRTLNECFRELITKRGWSKNSPYDRKVASVHKKLFLADKLPDETKRVYLQSAGWKCIQVELWQKDDNNKLL